MFPGAASYKTSLRLKFSFERVQPRLPGEEYTIPRFHRVSFAALSGGGETDYTPRVPHTEENTEQHFTIVQEEAHARRAHQTHVTCNAGGVGTPSHRPSKAYPHQKTQS